MNTTTNMSIWDTDLFMYAGLGRLSLLSQIMLLAHKPSSTQDKEVLRLAIVFAIPAELIRRALQEERQFLEENRALKALAKLGEVDNGHY